MAWHHRAIVVAFSGLTLVSAIAAVLVTGRHGQFLHDPATASTTPAWAAVTTAAKTTEINTGMDDETLVHRLAERYLEAVNTHDDATVAELNCAKAAPGLTQIAANGKPVTMTRLVPALAHEWYYLHLAIDGTPAGSRRIVKRDDTWCIED